MIRLGSVFLCASLVCAGCSSSSGDTEPARTALIETSRDWARAAAGGDVDRIVSFWADDAVVFPPDQAAVVGKSAIRQFVQASLRLPKFSITWEPEQARLSKSGDMGYLIERNRMTFADSSGVVHTQMGKAVTVWRKDTSGVWKCVIDTWNNSPTENVLAPAEVR